MRAYASRRPGVGATPTIPEYEATLQREAQLTAHGQPISVTLPTQVAPGDHPGPERHHRVVTRTKRSLAQSLPHEKLEPVRAAASQMGMPNAGAYNAIGSGSGSGHLTIRACTQVTHSEKPALSASCTVTKSRFARGHTVLVHLSTNSFSLSPARRPLQKSPKPTSTDGTGGQPPPMAQSPLNRVCKNFQNGDALLSRRGAGITQASHELHACHSPSLLSFPIAPRHLLLFYLLYVPHDKFAHRLMPLTCLID